MLHGPHFHQCRNLCRFIQMLSADCLLHNRHRTFSSECADPPSWLWDLGKASMQKSSVQFSHSVVSLFVTPWTAAHQASLSFTISWRLLKLVSIESVMSSNHLILCHLLLLLLSIFPSIRVFSNELVLCISWPKYWSFTSNISPFKEYSWLISFRMDWFDLLAVQGTLNTTKASIPRCSAFLIVRFSHPYTTTGKTIALTRWTFVGKVMSLVFNMLSRFVIASLPRRKHLLIAWLQSPSAVILEPKKIKSVTVSIVYPSICLEVMGLDAMIFVFFNIEFQASFFTLFFNFHQEAL